MNLENSIKDVITKKIEDGIIEKVIAEELEKVIRKSLDDLFSYGGAAKKVIKEKIESVIVPYLENYDYSNYILKLDTVLVEILKNTSLDNKKMLENFKDLMMVEERKTIKVSEIFDVWKKRVAKDIDTSELGICYDDGVSYNYANVTLEVEYEEDRSWSIYKYARLIFECEKDEEMNLEIRISKWENSKDEGWNISYENTHNISSLRRLDALEIFLMRLDQASTKIIIDMVYENDEVEVEAQPEASFD
ncbi:hypothetical protein [Tissierella sp.]|uniref:hypothetical protein n=1 Tax=Tissierella sp. TaxID=41274 RepID=UPI0028672419|nr:hypothetical protein [Tissierella sp.]MDR7856030.1 hypothetical protein [Tissierella sp.]